MKKMVLILVSLFIFCNAFGQEKKEFDFVIIINNDTNPNLSRAELQIEDINGETSLIDFKYHPGNFSISLEDYEKITSNHIKSIMLKFEYYIQNKNGIVVDLYRYEINMDESWFSHWPYTVLHIQSVKLKKKHRVDNRGIRKDYILNINHGSMGTVTL